MTRVNLNDCGATYEATHIYMPIADALALWAVRVLDAHGRLTRSNPQAPYPNRDGTYSVFSIRGSFADEDAARLAAADALAPELGDRCPRRPT